MIWDRCKKGFFHEILNPLSSPHFPDFNKDCRVRKISFSPQLDSKKDRHTNIKTVLPELLGWGRQQGRRVLWRPEHVHPRGKLLLSPHSGLARGNEHGFNFTTFSTFLKKSWKSGFLGAVSSCFRLSAHGKISQLCWLNEFVGRIWPLGHRFATT